MICRIPIRKIGGGRVAVVLFNGGRKTGVGRVVSETNCKEDGQAIRDIIAARTDLSSVTFKTTNGTVRGWKGFDGTLNALVLSLGAIGMEVETEAVTFPNGGRRGDV